MMEMAEFALESYRSTLEKILPALQKKSKKSYIGAAITLIVLHRIYSYFKVPKRFRHLPKLSYFPSAKSIFNNEPIYDRYKRLVFPVIKQNNGIYVVKLDNDLNKIINSRLCFYRAKSHLIGLFTLLTQ